jgi:lysophospholipase L1-like esterase
LTRDPGIQYLVPGFIHSKQYLKLKLFYSHFQNVIMKKLPIIPFLKTLLISACFISPAIGQTTLKIMPLGNSMTEGWMDGTETEGQKKAYRFDLKQLLTAAGYSIDYVGSHCTGSDYLGSDCQNAGISGTRDQYLETMLITGYDQRWDVQETPGPYLDAFNPDIILLSIGTNDITHDGTADEPDAIANQRVSGILDQIDAYEVRAHKTVIVFLALIINRRKLSDGNDAPRTYTTSLWNNTIKAMAQQRITNGDKIVIVDMEHDAGFDYRYIPSGDMYYNDPEGLHPSPSGYAKMASLWYQKFTANYNAAPVISSIPNQTVPEGSAIANIPLDNYVSDVEDADQYITWTTTQIGTSNLNIVINASRQAVVTPVDPNWNGTQTVVFTATDRGRGGNFIKSDADTVDFIITPVNDAPVITAQKTLSINEDNSILLKLSDFTVSDPDPDSDPSTFQLVVLPGTNYTINGNTVTPALNYFGNLFVNVAVRDATLQGASYPAIIAVNAINDSPVYISQPDIVIDEDHTYVVNLTNFNVTDPDNTIDQLVMVMSPGLNYTLIGSTVQPDLNYNGTIYVESFVRDPAGAVSATFYLEIIVNPVNDPPVFTSTPPDTAFPGIQYIYSIKVSDPDIGDVLVYSMNLQPSWLTFYPNSKLLAGVPHSGDPRNSGVSVRVTDGKVNVDQSFVIRVDLPSPVTDIKDARNYIYPNPATDQITIVMENRKSDLVFDLFDLTGKLVLHRVFCATCEAVIRFSESGVEPGAYIYKMATSGNRVNGKLLITD